MIQSKDSTSCEYFVFVISTNIYLRRIHNFALDMNWLPWPVLPKKRWPAIKFKDKRGITLAEHLGNEVIGDATSAQPRREGMPQFIQREVADTRSHQCSLPDLPEVRQMGLLALLPTWKEELGPGCQFQLVLERLPGDLRHRHITLPV